MGHKHRNSTGRCRESDSSSMDYGAGTVRAPLFPGEHQVRIIPASALRDQPYWFEHYGLQEPQISYPQPVNAAYYLGGMYNAGYAHEPYGHEPYGQNAFIAMEQIAADPSYNDPQWGYYGYNGYPYTSVYPGAYGPYPGASGAYRPYPQPQPSPPRRSRTAPSRTARSTTATATIYPGERKSRGVSADPYDRRNYKGYVGPSKKPLPMYKKRREPTLTRVSNLQDIEYTSSPLDSQSQFTRTFYNEAPTTLRRPRPFYAPSYTTYPPSTMQRAGERKLDSRRYPIFARAIIKFAQLILGAAILGLVLGPMHNYTFYNFVTRTNTEWQGLVVGIVAAFAFFAAGLLATCWLANRKHLWRKIDAHLTLLGIFGYLIVSFLEAYYAACYPPNGPKLNLVCHRAEWIIADILAFINLVLYVADFTMSFYAGVTML